MSLSLIRPSLLALLISSGIYAQAPSIGACTILPADNIWNTPVDTMPVSANSATYITTIGPAAPFADLWKLTIAQSAPVLPYLLMVLMLIFRPKGLLGTRAD